MRQGGKDRPTVRVVSVTKGGACKTTLAGHLASLYGENGLRVVVVDLDPQASLSGWLHPGGKADGETFLLAGWSG